VGRLERTLRQFRLLDARYPLRLSGVDGQVIVSGPPRYVDMVASVADRVALTPTKGKLGLDIRVFRLKYAKAADTTVVVGGVETRISGVARVLQEIVSDARLEPLDNDRVQPRNLPGLRGKGMLSIGRVNAASSSAFGTNAENDPANSSDVQPLGAVPPGTTNPAPSPPRVQTSLTGGNRYATVRAEPRMNAVIVRDSSERMAMYERLIKDLDIDLSLIEIEATVIDISDSKAQELGVDWRAHGRRIDISTSPNGLAGNGTRVDNIANNLLNTGEPTSSGSGLVGTLIFGSARSYFLARVNALSNNGDAKTVARPRVLTIDNTEAVLQSNNEFFVRVAGERQVDLFNVTVGLTLRVTPTLVEDASGRRVKLIVRIEDGTANSGQEVDRIPVVSRNSIATQAVVGEGQSLLIGGYMIEERSESKAGVPGLSGVPILGWLFGQKSTKFRQVERMFMITPRLITINDLGAVNPLKPLTTPPSTIGSSSSPPSSEEMLVPARVDLESPAPAELVRQSTIRRRAGS
jgi:type III secretion protein C